MGETIESRDNLGNVVYTSYYPDGNVKETYTSVHSPEKITFTYDDHGNRATISDPNAGLIETLYDGFGNLVLQVDVKGDSTRCHAGTAPGSKTRTCILKQL